MAVTVFKAVGVKTWNISTHHAQPISSPWGNHPKHGVGVGSKASSSAKIEPRPFKQEHGSVICARSNRATTAPLPPTGGFHHVPTLSNSVHHQK